MARRHCSDERTQQTLSYGLADSPAGGQDILQFGEREWARLDRAADGRVAFAVACDALARYLPMSVRVLDLGGGPGRYTMWLAQRGHRVVLADLSTELLRIAEERIWDAAVGHQVDAA